MHSVLNRPLTGLLAALPDSMTRRSPGLRGSKKPANLAFIDQLEARTYMSGTDFVTLDVVDDFPRIIVSNTTNNFVQYVDANGNTVRATLTGGGTISAFFAEETNADPAKILIEPSPAGKSSVVFTMSKSKGSTPDVTNVGDVVIEGSLVSFTAGKVNLTGDLNASGTIKALTLNDVNDPQQQIISIGGSAFDKTSLNFGRLGEVSIQSNGTIGTFKAIEWQDNNDTTDNFKAFSLGSFSITGSKATGGGSSKLPAVDGDMEADIELTRAIIGKAAPSIAPFHVAGSLTSNLNFGVHKVNAMAIKHDASGHWYSDAGFGTIHIDGQVTNLFIQSGQDISNIVLKSTAEFLSIEALGKIGSINAVSWIGGSLTAEKIGSFSIKGSNGSKSSPAIQGDFRGNVTINPNESATNGVVLGSLNIAGLVSDSTFEISGKVGSFQVGAITDSTFTFLSDVANFTSKGQAVNSTLQVIGSANAIHLVNWLGGSISANKISNLSTKGLSGTKGSTPVSGDFTGDLTVLGGGIAPSTPILGSASISGGLNNAHVRIQGKSGTITVGSADQSIIEVFSDLTSFTAKTQVSNTQLLAENIGSISVMRWLGGDIFANKIRTISTKDQSGSKGSMPTPGDFSANVTINANELPANSSALGSAKIAGSLQNTRWEILGKSGAITVGSANDVELNLTGDLAGFTSKLSVTDTSIVANNIGAITTMNWLSGLITANKITSITTKGLTGNKSSPGAAGDFTAQVQANGVGVTGNANVLGNVTIAGTLLNASISAMGNVGNITVGAAQGSSVQVNTNMPAFSIPVSRADFISVSSSLAGFTVTGKAVANANTTPSFVNTIVVAGVLSKVSLKLVDTNLELPNGFYAGSKIGSYTRQTGPSPANTFKLTPGNQTAPGSYDNAVPAGSGYALVIVPVNV